MKIMESCRCGASIAAEDGTGPTMRYPDGSGVGYAADFVERWRQQHYCVSVAIAAEKGG